MGKYLNELKVAALKESKVAVLKESKVAILKELKITTLAYLIGSQQILTSTIVLPPYE